LDFFAPGKKTTHPSILFVGTWSGRKRGHYLFEIFTKEVLPRVPNARLYMVSDQCPLSHDSVTHLSSPDDDTLATLYRKSWVLAHPSLYEGFGIPYIEAMASGTAVLSSPNPGSEYVLSNGKYGVLADDSSFPIELERLLVDSSYRQKYVERGLTRAPHFSWQNVACAHLSLYKKAIGIGDQ
jgi:glycosyltransferase involved in cell wall biosynthesis